MSKPVDRGRPAASTGSVEGRLARLLDAPQLARVVPHLPAGTLHQLIQYRGLDACGEILAAATPEQLSSVLDVDLWRPAQPASDEHFDPDRFGEWVETLVETGETVAARIVSGLDSRLVIAGLARHIRIFDPAASPSPSFSGDDELEGAAPFAGVSCDVGGYVVRARRTDAWDAIVELLLALEADHRDFFHRVMCGCRRLSDSRPEADGFHDLLLEPDQLLHDLGLDRHERRLRQGFLTPADARLVLDIARRAPAGEPGASSSINRLAADYLRAEEEPAEASATGVSMEPDAESESSAEAEVEESIDAVVSMLAEAGLVPERPRALLVEPPGQPSRVAQIRGLLEQAADRDAGAFAERSRELAFLANALMAGCSIDARPFTVQEASDAVVATCNLGLEEWQRRQLDSESGEAPMATGGRSLQLPPVFLVEHDLLEIFQLGWTALHEMSLWAAAQLVAVLGRFRCADLETQLALHVLERELAKQRAAGTPWRARDALDVIATLDMPAWVSLLGVLDECPVLPEALRATIERRGGAVNAKAFEFISTRSQIEDVRTFMGRLLDMLLR